MHRLFAGALALVLILPASAARSAGYPLVTTKCGCAIGGGLFIVNCGKPVCTKVECEKACAASLPKKTSAAKAGELTDVSAARRMARGGGGHRVAGLRGIGYRGDSGRARRGARAPAGVDVARAPQADRDGRGYAAPAAGVSAPIRAAAHQRARGVARQAIRGTSIGGVVAVEYSRPSDCYGIAWCGCWLRHVLGIPDRSLNLAIAWARVGAPAAPQEANVAVWRHHVAQVLSHEGNRILICSGNDRGAVRTRWVSPGILGGVVAWRRV